MEREILALIINHTGRRNIKKILDILTKQAEREGYRKARREVADAMSFLVGNKWAR
jgi:hypothetical protein